METRTYQGHTYQRSAPGEAWQLVGAAAPVAAGMVITDPAQAYAAPKAQAELQGANLRNQTDAAELPYAARKAAADAAKAEAEARVAAITAAQGGQGKNVSPEVRKDAINQYRSAIALGPQIDYLEKLFNDGPGATHGVKGLKDFLPLEGNERFNAASDRLRGPVINAFGFTSGQSNTPGEVKMNIGGYIPNSGDRFDSVSRDKIAALRALQQNAVAKAQSILGGVPDEQGNITRQHDTTPAVGASPAVGGTPPGSSPPPDGGSGGPQDGGNGGPALGLATGKTRTEIDPTLSAKLEQMIRSGASAAEMSAAVGTPVDPAEVARVRAYLSKHPGYHGFAPVTRQSENSILSRVAASPVGAGIISAGDAILPMKPLLSEEDAAKLAAVKQENPTSSLVGTLIGGVPAAAGLEGFAARALPRFAARAAPLVGDALYGGIQGAGNSDDPVTGGVSGATAGVIGGLLGRGVTRGAARALRGVTDPSVQYLRGQDIPLTVGQALGGTAKQIEDQASGYPFIGATIKSRREEGLTGFNRAMFRQGAEGMPIHNIGERGAEELDNTVTQAYAPLSRYAVQADDPFLHDFTMAGLRGNDIPGRERDFNFAIDRRVEPNFDENAVMSGSNMQDTLRGLSQEANGQPITAMHPGAYSDALGDVSGAIRGMVERQAPEALETLDRGNRIYRNQSIIDQAVKAARNTRGPEGDALVMPSQLNTASVQNTTKYGGASRAATTDRPFYDLATHGQEVLPSKVADSGTAGRLALAALATAVTGGGGALGYGEGGADGAVKGGGAGLGSVAALLAAGSLGGSRPAQRAIVSLLADRPDLIRSIGMQLYDRAAVAGPLGAPAALQLKDWATAP